jgi:hypothetical protein
MRVVPSKTRFTRRISRTTVRPQTSNSERVDQLDVQFAILTFVGGAGGDEAVKLRYSYAPMS